MICFGNEPSWSVDLTEPGVARVATPDGEQVVYRGTATRHAFLPETLWRGSPAAGRDLVVWLQDSTCTDNMSGNKLPVTARVSMPDGRFLSGCCRVPSAVGRRPSVRAAGRRRMAAEGNAGPAIRRARPAGPPGDDCDSSPGDCRDFAGCNNFSGSYTAGRRPSEDRARGQHADGLPGAGLRPSRQAFHAALSGTLRYAVDGDDLTATTATGATLRFQREPPPQLAGVNWKVTNFNNNRDAVVGVTRGIEPDDVLQGRPGRGQRRLQQRSTGRTRPRAARSGLARWRRHAAPATEPLMTQEQEFLAALASAVTWSIDGNVLDMHRADGERAIWAVPE